MRKVFLVAAVAVGLISCSRDQPSPSPESTATLPPPPAAAPASDGTDPKAPVLSPDDANFVDTRKGGGWGDRCFNENKQGKWGWAHAACDRALALPDVDPKVRPLLLYNEGLIAKQAGDNAAARSYFTQSLALRPATDSGRAEVERELVSVGGTPVPLCNGANAGKSAGVCPAGQQCTCRNVGGNDSTPQHCACETPPAAGTCGDTGQRCGGGQKCCRQAHSGAPYFCTAPDDSLICDG